MCLPFLCCGGGGIDDGAPASHPAQKLQAPGTLLSSAENGVSSHPVQNPPAPVPLPSSVENEVSKPPGAAGGNKLSLQEPEKFDTAKKEGDKKNEKVKQGEKPNPDYPISNTTTNYKPSSPIEKPNKRDDSAKKGGQDADARSWINQDQRLPSVDGVGSQASRGRINQDQERRASTNEPIREAVDYRFPRADDIGSLANPISRKDQPRRGAHIY